MCRMVLRPTHACDACIKHSIMHARTNIEEKEEDKAFTATAAQTG